VSTGSSVFADDDRQEGPLASSGESWTSKALALHGFTVAALAAWWLYAQFVPAYLVPSPLVVFARMGAFLSDPQLALQLAISLGHVGAAILLSFIVGGALAFAAHYLSPLRLMVDARITPFLNAFSGIGWLFLGIIWFGIDSTTVIFAVSMILIPFAIINLRTGLIELDSELVELGRSLSRSRWRRFAKLLVPMLVPYVFATLRTSFGVAWKVTLTAELFGGNAGVGYLLNVARQEFDTETVFAVILFIILFVACAETLFFRPLQRRLDRRYRHA
jgi:ABC-type nitrate/sulfonate/bicarbonate transport system permease component